RQQVGVMYSNLGDILGNPTMPNVGRPAEALEFYRKSLAIASAQFKEDPADRGSAAGVAIMTARIANVTDDSGEALRLYRQSRDSLEPIVRGDGRGVRLQTQLIYTLTRLADRLQKTGDANGALRSYRDAMAWGEPMQKSDPADQVSKRLMIECYRASAIIL